MHDNDDKVITFPGAEPIPDNPLTLQPKSSLCGHEVVSLDEHQRVVNCVNCGAVLDPFNFLRDNARTLQSAWQRYRMVNAKVSETHDRLQVLEKERKRLAAQVKRLRDKAAPILDVRGTDEP